MIDSLTFTCARCGRAGRIEDDEAARAELREVYGDVPVSECVIVCDDCWEVVRP